MYNDNQYHINLPLEKRKEMYRELLALDNKAREEAHENYPVDATASDSVKLAQIKAGNQIQHQYREEFREKYSLTYEQVAGLQAEGHQQGW